MRMLLYNNGSECGKRIAEELNANIDRKTTSRDKCINWGSGTHRKVRTLPSEWLNKREAVEIAGDKIKTLNCLDDCDVSIPEFTTEHSVAKDIVEDGEVIYCRTLTRANQGRGIIVAEDEDDIVSAPLYTVKCDADREYRVHVFMGRVIGVARKIPKEDCEVNEEIRSHNNGWKLSMRDMNIVHSGIKQLGINAVEAIGLDFGAVDLLWNKDEEQGYVLEVNTAPSLEDGSTIFNKYISCFKAWYNCEEFVDEYQEWKEENYNELMIEFAQKNSAEFERYCRDEYDE